MNEEEQQCLTAAVTDTAQNTLQFKNVHLSIGDRVILDTIHGQISSQNILALMGPSGSGKSSLLNVLSFRRELISGGDASGSVTLNNVPLSRKDRYRIGYVMQEDIFFPTLTLYETLTFYVNLRISSKYTKKEKEQIITKLAQYMHLEKCMNTIMGCGLIRGLSGGERKRVSVACELITDPVILMLDEPTSGLDSFMAANVINILKNYCKTRNKIVIASIHQPSSQTFHCFDHLVLLARGQQIYEGSTLQVSTFLSDCGFNCPPQWNISDFMLEVVGSNEESIDKVVEEFKKIKKGHFDKQHVKNDPDYKSYNGNASNLSDTIRKKWPAGLQIQFHYLIRRSLLQSIEDQFSPLALFKALFVSVFMGIAWLNTPWNASHFQDILGLLYYLIVESCANSFFTSVFVFEVEKPVLSRERMASMYSLALYYIAKIVSELPALILRPLFHTIFVYPMVGLAGGPTFVFFFLILFLVNLVGMNFGLFLSSLGFRQRETLTLMVMVFIIFNLYGGFFVSKLPVWLKWGKYLSPFFSGYVLLTYTQFNYRNLKCDVARAIPQCWDVPPDGTISVVEIMHSIEADISYYWYIVILVGTSILLNIVTFFFLRKTITKPSTGFKICELCNPVNLITRTYKRIPNSSTHII